MKDRFTGKDGKRRLLDAVLQQPVTGHDKQVAEMLVERGELVEFAAGEIVCEQDGCDNDILLLLTGDVNIYVKKRLIGTRSHTIVGEMAALDPTAPRSASMVALTNVTALRIAEKKFAQVTKAHPLVWKAVASVLADRLRERAKFLRPPNTKPALFIGCSVEGLPVAKAIELGLKHAKFDLRLWTNNVFGPSGVPINDLLMQVERADFAAFVFGPDDKIGSRDKKSYAPRDNVIFEMGLFMGRLGRERTFMVMQHRANLKIPSDLIGVTPITYMPNADKAAMVSTVCTEIEDVVKKVGVV